MTDSEHVIIHNQKLKGPAYKLSNFMNTNLYKCFKFFFDKFALLMKKKDVSDELIFVRGQNAVHGNAKTDRLATLALIKAGLKRSKRR